MKIDDYEAAIKNGDICHNDIYKLLAIVKMAEKARATIEILDISSENFQEYTKYAAELYTLLREINK